MPLRFLPSFAIVRRINRVGQSCRPSGSPLWQKAIQMPYGFAPGAEKRAGFVVFKRRRHYPTRAFLTHRYTLCKLLLHNSNDFAQEAYNFRLSARVGERSTISRPVTMAGSPRCNVTTFAITACHHADKAPSHSLSRHCPCAAVCCVTKVVPPSRAILSFNLP